MVDSTDDPSAAGNGLLSRSWIATQLNPWAIATIVIVAMLVAPIVAVFVAATGDSGGLWGHLFETVLPRYVANSLILMIGVGIVALVFGISTAWAVTIYEFPARRYIEWMLLLPAAVPAYLVAYTYTDFLEYAGPLQGALRDLFGWQSARDYWFPEIRSIGGAMLVIGAVLYPYVYMMARTAFVLTPASLFETAKASGRNIFWAVGLPLARPAIVAGLALVLMETLSDFGTVEYFAIETLTLGIFNVWLGMNSLPAAAELAIIAFLFIIALLVIERVARANRRYTDTTKRSVPLPPERTSGWGTFACLAVCAVPIFVGFVLPVGVLLNFVLRGESVGFSDVVITAALNSVTVALSAAFLIMSIATFMALVATYQAGPILRRATAFASIGYAFPGTILAIGVVTAGGAIDRAIAAFAQAAFGLTYSGWLAGSIALVVLACVVRFQAIGYGAMTSGLERLPPNLLHASRTLGLTFGGTVRTVILPLIQKSFIAGGLLVFVDVMKELPMTLLLRPFNFETLATYVYQFAKDELLEEAALPALLIVLAGIPPIIIMNAALRRLAR
ncbi:MAG: iron ABC transporter permease [Hyphomicrobiaceae bacterium]